MPKKRVADIEQGVFRSRAHPHVSVRTTAGSVQPYAAHFHDCLSLGAVFAGRTRLSTPEGGRILETGDAVLLAPEQVHACNPVDGAPRSYHMFYIDAAWVLARIGAASGGAIRIDAPLIRDASVFALLTALADAVRTGKNLSGAAGRLAACIVPRCRACPPRSPARSGGGRRETFIRAFRRDTGLTPGSHRQCLRLAKAQRLLRGGADICRTALECGYADQSHFHRMCVKYLAATPKQLKTTQDFGTYPNGAEIRAIT